MSAAQEIMEILDEGREKIPSGLYLELANKLRELHEEKQPPVVRAPPAENQFRRLQQQLQDEAPFESPFEAQLRRIQDRAERAERGRLHQRSARIREQIREQCARERRQKQAERINELRKNTTPSAPPLDPKKLAGQPSPKRNYDLVSESDPTITYKMSKFV